MSQVHVLYNPLSGNGCEQGCVEVLGKFFPGDEITYQDITTLHDYRVHLNELSPEVRMVICGGDGTLNRFVNGIYDLEIANPVYYYPTGSGNDYLKIGGTKAAQATLNLDAGAEAGIYVFKMRLKLQNADDVIKATHFAYRYLKGEKNVKNTFINIEKNRLEVGGYVLGTLTADEWMDIMVMLDFKTGIGEVFYDDPGYRRTFELDPISTSGITLFSTNDNGVLCIDDLQVYTCSRLSVIKPPDEANKNAELIIPSTPIPELDPAYNWYYSTDFEYWNKGA